MNLQQHILEWLDSIGADGMMFDVTFSPVILKANLKDAFAPQVCTDQLVPAYRHADGTYHTAPEHWFLCKTCICDCMPIEDDACSARFDANECTPYQSWLAHKEAK